MGKFGDFLQPAEMSYPGAPGAAQAQSGQACGNLPFAPPVREGLFHKWFAPKELPYPVPLCVPRPTTPPQPATPDGRSVGGGGILTRPAEGVGAAGSGAGASDAGRTGGGAVVTGPASSGVAAPAAPPVTVVLVPLNGANLPASVSAPTVAVPAAVVPAAPVVVPAPATSGNGGATSAPAPAVASAAPAAPVIPAAPVAPSVPIAPAAPTVAAPVAPTVAPAVPIAATVPVAPMVPAAPATPTAPAAPAAPAVPVALPMLAPIVDGCEQGRVQPEPAVFRLDVQNPTFTPCHATAQETYLEDALGEEVSARILVRESGPFVLRVPEGYDSLDVFYAPIELAPCGTPSDLDQVVTVGDAKITAAYGEELCGPLTAGQALYVKIPWRAASWVDMPAGRLNLPVYVRFYKAGEQ